MGCLLSGSPDTTCAKPAAVARAGRQPQRVLNDSADALRTLMKGQTDALSMQGARLRKQKEHSRGQPSPQAFEE